MPTYARHQIVIEDKVGVYHCIARCVRRAFLCGTDPYTGQDYSRQALAETGRSTRDASSHAASRPRERMRWSVVPIHQIVRIVGV